MMARRAEFAEGRKEPHPAQTATKPQRDNIPTPWRRGSLENCSGTTPKWLVPVLVNAFHVTNCK
jgi:hypothetical protein